MSGNRSSMGRRVAGFTGGAVFLVLATLGFPAPDMARAAAEAVSMVEAAEMPRSFGRRPSHEGLYRAEIVASPRRIRGDVAQRWVLRLETASGQAVSDARVTVSAAMPETGVLAPTGVRVTPQTEVGRYAIEQLRLPAAGWWNVRLTITAAAGTDSLAFNLTTR